MLRDNLVFKIMFVLKYLKKDSRISLYAKEFK